jgi:anti-anti-sigma factor
MATTKPGTSAYRKLQIEYQHIEEDVYCVRLRGILAMNSMPALAQVTQKIFDKGIYRIVICLDDLVYMASSAVGFFITCSKEARVKGGDVVVTGASKKMMNLFELLGLHDVLKFAPDEESGLGMIRK